MFELGALVLQLSVSVCAFRTWRQLADSSTHARLSIPVSFSRIKILKMMSIGVLKHHSRTITRQHWSRCLKLWQKLSVGKNVVRRCSTALIPLSGGLWLREGLSVRVLQAPA